MSAGRRTMKPIATTLRQQCVGWVERPSSAIAQRTKAEAIPSSNVSEDDGFRKLLNPSYGFAKTTLLSASGTREFAIDSFSARQVICPSCQCVARTFACDVGQITGTFPRISRPTGGAYRDRHGRWARDAMDADGSLTNAPSAYGKAMRSCRPDAGVKLRGCLRYRRQRRRQQSRSPGRTWNKPSNRRAGKAG